MIGTKWFPRRRDAFRLNAADGLMCALIPVTGWSLPLLNVGIVVISINTLMTGGPSLLKRAVPFALLGVAIGAISTAGMPSQTTVFSTRTWLVSALAVATEGILVALSTYRAYDLLQKTQSELAALNRELDAKVLERTASLAATNTAISRFVPTEFLHALGHVDVTTAKLGDVVERDIAVLFADIRNFTSISEHYTPQETFDFLNQCLSKIGPHIRAQSGFIDKYIGDAVMALFPEGPEGAVRAARAMQQEVHQFNLDHPGDAKLAIGIGIHCGPVMMGTIGEHERFEATVISDAVNLTSRLEGLTKQLGCTILVSGEVTEVLPATARDDARLIGRFRVKGKRQPVEIHEIFGADPDESRERKRACQPQFSKAIAHYENGDAESAASEFRQISQAMPTDGPTAFWLSRLTDVLTQRRAQDPLGVVVLDQK
ncbi:MAG: adenylate/guanylate cyclase domain-containing protein [Polyangiaceae bacterium]